MNYNFLNKTIIFFTVFTVLLTFPALSLAKTATPSSRESMKDEIQQLKEQKLDNKTTDLKQRADKEIDRRIASLNKLTVRINSAKHLTTEQKAALSAKVQNAIDNLTSLKTKIDNDTDPIALKTDVKSVTTSYKIYALVLPQIQIIAAADRLLDISNKEASVAAKLQTKINDAQTAGKDVNSLQTMLSDMQSKITDAKTQGQNAISAVLNLNPDSDPGSASLLKNARSMIQIGQQDVVSARKDAESIVQGLKALGETTQTATPSSK